MTQQELPEFERPPLIETAMGVQFEPIPQLPLFFGNFIDQRADVVRVEIKPPLDPVIERIGGRGLDSKSRIEILEYPPHPRYWLFGKEDTDFLQLQNDRIVWNWRKKEEGGHYPRFKKIFNSFTERYEAFSKYAEEHSIPEFKINQCEITYVNQIVSEKGIFESHAESKKVFSCWNNVGMNILPKFESNNFSARHLLSNSAGEFMGRLHVVVEPAFFKEKPAFAFNLVARGRPLDSSFQSLTDFFIIGHHAIVTAFKAYTTPIMHNHWGLKK